VVKITEQITIKLNAKRFRPLLKKLEAFGGHGLTDSDSDLVGKALFYCYYSIYCKKPDCKNMSTFEMVSAMSGKEKPELVLNFLNKYAEFKKQGLKK
jgi:hypothetical protein